MSCEKNSKRGFRAAVAGGLSRLASQAAYAAGIISQTGQRVRTGLTVTGGPPGYAAGSVVGRRVGQRSVKSRWGTAGRVQPGPLVERDQFNLPAGVELSDNFSGAVLPLASLLSAVGDRETAGQMRPLVKMGGADDLFGAAGVRGQVAFTLPDGPTGAARIEGVLPARGREKELAGALDGRLPQYLITDPETGHVYATRKPVEARQFARALNQAPEETVFEVHPGETGFDDADRAVPAALFY